MPIFSTLPDNLSRDELEAICQDLLNRPSILNLLSESLHEGGFAGSTEVPQLAYLSFSTRHFEKPVSLVMKGPSGSGKSYALRSALDHVPPSAYELFAGMSEKALIYSGLNLKHRYLILQEAAGLSEGVGRAFLRQLLTEGKVRYQTVQSTKDGLIGEELPPIEGPAGLMMTTTANSLHPEDESRMLTVQLNESSERIREALVAQTCGQVRPERDMTRWHALDAYIASGDFNVDIPFGRLLAERLPTSHFRVLRDFPQVLSLIKAHALLHQCRRDRDDGGNVIATVEDYSVVHSLVNETISQGLETAVPLRIRLTVEAVEHFLNEESKKDGFKLPPVGGVSQRQLADRLGRDQGTVSRNVAAAIDQGFLVNLSPGQGREATLVLGPRQLPQGYALPAPEELTQLLAA
jgi:hypothetical protein